VKRIVRLSELNIEFKTCKSWNISLKFMVLPQQSYNIWCRSTKSQYKIQINMSGLEKNIVRLWRT